MRASPASLLRQVEQHLQSALDAHPDQDRIMVQAEWARHWQDLIMTARMTTEEPLGLGGSGLGLALLIALSAFGSGLALGWLVGCG